MTHLLTLLVALPLVAAVVVLAAPRPQARLLASAGAGLVFLLALWACLGLWWPGPQSLRTAYLRQGGLVDQALARAGPEDELLRAALGELLRDPERTPEQLAGELHRLAGVGLAAANLEDLRRLVPQQRIRVQQAREELAAAQERVRLALAAWQRLERELGPARRAAFSPLGDDLIHVVRVPWLPGLGVSWYLGLDGLSGPLVLLTALLGLVAAVSAGRSVAPAALAACLAGEAGLILLYVSLDLVLFYAAWVLVLLPGWALLASGASERRAAVGLRLALPALAGALGLLLALVVLAGSGRTGGPCFDLPTLCLDAPGVPFMGQALVFVAVAVAAAVRLPLPPLHGWLAPAQRELSGSAGALVLGAGLPAGGYVLLRLGWPLAPDVVTHPGVALGVAGVGLLTLWFAAALALGARSLPRLGSCLALDAGGLVLLGASSLTSQGLMGAGLVLVAQGLVVAGVGLARQAGPSAGPGRALLAGVLLAAAGLPGLVGFPAILLVLGGVSASTLLPGGLALLALGGLALQALAVARWLRAAPAPEAPGEPRALVGLVPLLAALVLIGVWPRLLLDPLSAACQALLAVIAG